MRIIQRVGYYLVGVAIGLVLLAVFVKGKKGEGGFWDDFAYLPEARVIKSLGNMLFMLSAKAKQHNLDQHKRIRLLERIHLKWKQRSQGYTTILNT